MNWNLLALGIAWVNVAFWVPLDLFVLDSASTALTDLVIGSLFKLGYDFLERKKASA